MSQIQQAFVIDGKVFATKAEAQAFIRRPLILKAFLDLTKNNEELSNWLVENQETVEAAFETGTIRRVTKSDYNKLDKALAELTHGFLFDNLEAVRESFRWPAVKRLTAEQKVAEATTLLANASGNPELAAYVVANQDAILEGYKAGVEKREINTNAVAGLNEWRARQAAEKAELEAAALIGPEEVEAVKAKHAAATAERNAAKAAA
jgi:hypothetical protein